MFFFCRVEIIYDNEFNVNYLLITVLLRFVTILMSGIDPAKMAAGSCRYEYVDFGVLCRARFLYMPCC